MKAKNIRTFIPCKDENAPVGRMVINKNYTGDIEGSGVGQMISKRTDSGIAVYFAIEEFAGTVDGKTGAFTLVHNGYMSGETQSLDIKPLKDQGVVSWAISPVRWKSSWTKVSIDSCFIMKCRTHTRVLWRVIL